MNCDEFRVRLDHAGPAGPTPAQLAHARDCAACAAELQAAQAVEARLRATPPTPSHAFTADVMSRVEATERARQRLAEMPRVPVWQRWVRAVAYEPAAIVALALAPVPILMAVFWPGSAANVTAFLHDALATWVAAANSGTAFAGSGVGELSSPLRAMANLLAIPLLITLAALGFQWIGAGFRGSRASQRSANQK